MRGSVLGRLLVGLLAVSCGARPSAAVVSGVHPARTAPPSASATVSAPKTPCTRAAGMREATQRMRAGGELARALRTLARADALCPASARAGQALALDTTLELGLFARARVLGAALAAQSGLSSAEQGSLQRLAALPPSEDFGAGRAPGTLASLVTSALARGDSAEARRELSRALVALERAERVPLVADTVAWAPSGALEAPALTSGASGWYARRGFDVRPAYVAKDSAPELIDIVDVRTRRTRLRVQRVRRIPADTLSPIAGLIDVSPHTLLMVDDAGIISSVDLDTGATKSVADPLKHESGLAWCGEPYGEPRPAALSAAGDLLAYAPLGGGVQIYRASTGTLLETIAGQGRVRSMGDIGEVGTPCRVPAASGLRFAPDGSALVFTTPDHRLEMWRAGTRGARVLTPPVLPAEFGPAEASAESVTPEVPRRALARTVAVAVNAPSKSAALLLQWPDNAGTGVLLVLRAEARSIVRVPIEHVDGLTEPPGLMSFDASGRYVAALDGPGVTLVEVATGRRSSLPAPPSAHVFAFSPSGEIVAVAGEQGGVTLWDTAHAKPQLVIDSNAGSLRSLAWRSDGKQLAYGSDDGHVHVIDPSTGKPLAPELTLGSARAVAALTFDVAGHRLYALGGDYGQRSWDLLRGAAPETAPPKDKIRAFGDPRYSITWRKSSDEPDLRAVIDYCSVPNACGSANCVDLWDSFPNVTADCHVFGATGMWQARIGSTLRPAEYVEITPALSPGVAFLRAVSPDVIAHEPGGPYQVRLLSGEAISVDDSAFDGFSSVDALGDEAELECRVGRWVFPIAACGDLLVRKSLLRDALSGDDAYRDD